MIYFFEFLKAGEVKIGFSDKSPESRLRMALTYVDVRVLLVLPDGDRRDEKWFHRQLRHLRVAGERFTLTDELRTTIASYADDFDWDAELRRRMREAEREYERARRADPAVRERHLENDRASYRIRMADPAVRDHRRALYAAPDVRQAKRARDRDYRADPAVREAKNAASRARRTDPAVGDARREYEREHKRVWRAARKASLQ